MINNNNSENWFRTIFDNAADGILIAEMETKKIIEANNIVCKMLGYSLDEIKNLWVDDIYPEGDLISDSDNILCKRKDGTAFYCNIKASLVVQNDKKYIIGFFRDMTKICEMHQKIFESEERFRTIFDQMTDCAATYEVVNNGEDFVIKNFNPAAEKTENVKKESVIGKNVIEIFPGVEEFGLLDVFKRVWKTGKSEKHPVSFYKDNRLKGWRFNFVYKLSSSEIVSIYEDVTEQITSDEQIRLQALVLDQIGDYVTIADLDGNITYVNNTLRSLMESPGDTLIGKNVEVYGEDLKRGATQKEIIQKTLSNGFWRGEVVNQTAEGNDVIMDSRIQVVFDVNAKPICLCGIATDITERKKMEDLIRLSEMKFKSLFNKMINGFAFHEIICDDHGNPVDYRFLDVNPSFEQQTGLKRDDIIGKTVKEVFPNTESYWIKIYGNVSLTGEPIFFEKYAKEFDKYFEVTAYCPADGHFACIINDVTKRKKEENDRVILERQVKQAQKLESLGVLAGGIAHDFNNLLMAIMGNAEMALYNLSPMSAACQNLQAIVQASTRAAELSKQMLAYSGKGKFVVEPILAHELIEEMLHLLEVSISKKAVLKYNFAENVPTFDGDATQIRQIVMNMIINASEAIGDKSGVIAISIGAMECDRNYLEDVNEILRSGLNEPLSEGIYTYIEVADTGCGMNEDILNKIFDPFFTTKFTGRGLGMSAVLGIIRGHSGAIKIYSELGKGTTIKVLFPSNDLTVNGFSVEQKKEIDEEKLCGSGTILIVDDEETVCVVGKQMLQRLGFSVLTAPDGREALEVFRKHADEIVCTLLDLTMPHIDGEEAFRELRRLQPEVKVILCSGYNEQDATQCFVGKGLAGFLQKPYNFSTLRKKLMSILADQK